MRNRMLLMFVSCLPVAGGALAQQQRLYLVCNHPSHNYGKYQKIGGPWDKIAPCDIAMANHKASHGRNSEPFTATCSWRKTEPE